MKKLSLIFLAATIGFAADAATSLNVVKGNITYNFNADGENALGYMPFTNEGRTLTIQGSEIDLTTITNIHVGTRVLDDNTVEVVYNGQSATVTIAGNIYGLVTAAFDGAHVTLDQSSDVGDDTGEITYILKGESADGSLVLNGKYKATVELQGLTLTNPSGAAIDIQNGKRIEFSSKNGYTNYLTDGKNGSQKGALYCKGHL